MNTLLIFLGLAFWGLILGSFLNVLIYALPKGLTFFFRRSACPHCKHVIAIFDNIPILSFFLLKRKCRHCKALISWRYPLVESLSAFFTLIVFYGFGFTIQGVAAWVFFEILLVLFFIDWETYLLPDILTYSVIWLGLLANLYELFTSLEAAVIGTIAGYVSLWSVTQIYGVITGREGMGRGDFKLLAGLGAWLGWVTLPYLILIASVVGLSSALLFFIYNYKPYKKEGLNFRRLARYRIPFGPYLAIAGWVLLIGKSPLLCWW